VSTLKIQTRNRKQMRLSMGLGKEIDAFRKAGEVKVEASELSTTLTAR